MTNSECKSCPVHHEAHLRALGIDMSRYDFVVALAGNPNTGKSTLFNALTGLRQHTGNWPGKTVARAEGAFAFGESRYKVVDLPGTYSLLSTSTDEEVARDFILFGKPDVTVIVVDATRLQRSLNLVLQILEITDRAVLALNLMDEAGRHGIEVDVRGLSKALGVPVVPMVARSREGLPTLLQMIDEVATGAYRCKPRRLKMERRVVEEMVCSLEEKLAEVFPGVPNLRWVALRLLEGDQSMMEAVSEGHLGAYEALPESEPEEVLALAQELRWQLGTDFHDELMESIFSEAAKIAGKVVRMEGKKEAFSLDRAIDRVVTSRLWGFPIMLGLLALVFWLTIVGANYPSAMLSGLLVERGHPFLRDLFLSVGAPAWLTGLLIDGAYLSAAWVVSVMLPPMAIFFPLFTLLEDFGYLPRVSFNMDRLFKRVGAHGKQALTMSMGFGCNAAGVVATRVIDSPRERLIAIITNNFALCNGRWPLQILLATVFIGAVAPAHWAGVISAAAVVGVAVLGILFSLAVSWALSRTVLKGEASAFSLELPPYRPPRFWETLYTSFIERTLIVLWRAVVFALPAGMVIWLLANVHVGGLPLAEHFIRAADPVAMIFGLNGVILLAYLVAIPANELVIPTILMLTVMHLGMEGVAPGQGVLFELEDAQGIAEIFTTGGWTLLTAVNVMLFSLLHNPCSTTIYTIYKETGSAKWTALATFLPIGLGLLVCLLVALVAG